MKGRSTPSSTEISVVMPVYNAGKYLTKAMESILSQTHSTFEFVIVDDCSTDSSWKILQSFAKKDKRIRLFRNTHKQGVSLTVKKAINHATGEYLARMDADDIALPTRLEKQLTYLKKHKQTVAIGGQCILIDADNSVIGEKTFPTSFTDVYRYSFHFVPVQQPTLMIARSRLPEDFEFYQDGMNTAEEVELFFKLFQYGKVENLSIPVLLYRLHTKNTSFANLRQTFFLTLLSRIKAIYKYNYTPTITGIIYNFVQAILILTLPKRVILFLYRIVRHLGAQPATLTLKKTRPLLVPGQ